MLQNVAVQYDMQLSLFHKRRINSAIGINIGALYSGTIASRSVYIDVDYILLIICSQYIRITNLHRVCTLLRGIYGGLYP